MDLLHITLLPDEPAPTLLRQSDSFLMERSAMQYKKANLKKINACRLRLLQVSRLSGITNASRTTLISHAVKGNHSDHLSESATRWPRRGQPASAWWTLWSKALRSCFSADGNVDHLRHPLRQWLHSARSEWQTLYHPASNRLFNTLPDGSVRMHGHVPSHTHHLLFSHQGTLYQQDTIPPNAVPATSSANRRHQLKIQ
jgi:hypothetical protein